MLEPFPLGGEVLAAESSAGFAAGRAIPKSDGDGKSLFELAFSLEGEACPPATWPSGPGNPGIPGKGLGRLLVASGVVAIASEEPDEAEGGSSVAGRAGTGRSELESELEATPPASAARDGGIGGRVAGAAEPLLFAFENALPLLELLLPGNPEDEDGLKAAHGSLAPLAVFPVIEDGEGATGPVVPEMSGESTSKPTTIASSSGFMLSFDPLIATNPPYSTNNSNTTTTAVLRVCTSVLLTNSNQ